MHLHGWYNSPRRHLHGGKHLRWRPENSILGAWPKWLPNFEQLVVAARFNMRSELVSCHDWRLHILGLVTYIAMAATTRWSVWSQKIVLGLCYPRPNSVHYNFVQQEPLRDHCSIILVWLFNFDSRWNRLHVHLWDDALQELELSNYFLVSRNSGHLLSSDHLLLVVRRNLVLACIYRLHLEHNQHGWFILDARIATLPHLC